MRRGLFVSIAVMVVLGAGSASGSVGARSALPEAKLKWSIPERYGRSWQAWSQAKATYEGSYARATTTEATFDLCGSVASRPITRYLLTLRHVGSSLKISSSNSRCIKRFKRPPVLDGQELPCPECDGPELPYGVYQIRYAVATREGFGPAKTGRIEIRDYLVVSLGDSLASGEGAPDTHGRYEFSFTDRLDVVTNSSVKVTERAPVRWKDRRCHRSARAGHALFAERLEKRDEHSSVTFLSLACSGAEVVEGVLGPYGGMEPPSRGRDLPAQVDALRGLLPVADNRRTIDVLLLQVGINDLDFSDIIVACAGNRDINAGDSECMYKTGFGRKLRTLRSTYVRLGKVINARFPGAEVYVADYPGEVFKGGGCGLLGLAGHGITTAEAQAIAAGGRQLNAELQRLAWRFDWNYIGGVTEAFAPHAYCSSSRWFNRIEDSFRQQGNREGTAHPNRRGHEAYRDAFTRAVVVDYRKSPSYRVALTIHRVRLGSVGGRNDSDRFEVRVPTRGDELLTTSQRYTIARRGELLIPEQGPLTYSRLIYEKPQPARHLTEFSFVLSGVGGTLPVLHKAEEAFKPTCIASSAGPCHVRRLGNGRLLASNPNGRIAVEYSITVRRPRPGEIPGPTPPKTPGK